MTHDDIFRAMLRDLGHLDHATAMHQEQVKLIAAKRRTVVQNMINEATRAGQKQPQAYVAGLLGISQQRVSKILKGN